MPAKPPRDLLLDILLLSVVSPPPGLPKSWTAICTRAIRLMLTDNLRILSQSNHKLRGCIVRIFSYSTNLKFMEGACLREEEEEALPS